MIEVNHILRKEKKQNHGRTDAESIEKGGYRGRMTWSITIVMKKETRVVREAVKEENLNVKKLKREKKENEKKRRTRKRKKRRKKSKSKRTRKR